MLAVDPPHPGVIWIPRRFASNHLVHVCLSMVGSASKAGACAGIPNDRWSVIIVKCHRISTESEEIMLQMFIN